MPESSDNINVYQDYEPPVTGGLFHKFEDGVTYVFRLLTDPAVFESIYVDKKDPSAEPQVSTKYAWLVWDVEAERVKILQLPVTPYKQLAAVAVDPEYGDPKSYNLKFTRTGKSRDTVYNIIASPRKNNTHEEYPEAIKGMMEVDLLEKLKGDNTQHIFWLKDVIRAQREGKQLSQADALKAAKTADDLVPAEKESPAPTPTDGKEPIDLSDIPF